MRLTMQLLKMSNTHGSDHALSTSVEAQGSGLYCWRANPSSSILGSLATVFATLALLNSNAFGDIAITWQTALGGGNWGGAAIKTQLTPDGTGLMAFVSTHQGTAVVSKLSPQTGGLLSSKTLSISGMNLSSGFVDPNGSVYLGTGWGGNTLYKYDSTLSSRQWTYQDWSGAFEYVDGIVSDTAGNVYTSGFCGSWSGGGSKIEKITSAGIPSWGVVNTYTSNKDQYDIAMALSPSGIVYRAGCDRGLGNPGSQGRIIGYNTTNGSQVLNVTVPGPAGAVFGLAVDAGNNLYDARIYNYATSGQEQTVVEKRDSSGNLLWTLPFNTSGMTMSAGNAIVKQSDDSYLLAYTQRTGGTTLPGLARFNSSGQLLSKDTLDMPGYSVTGAMDVRGNTVYMPVSNSTTSQWKAVGVNCAITPPAAKRPVLPLVQPATAGEKGLICIVHGWNSDPSQWANGMKADIETKLRGAGQSDNWTVLALDWSDVSNLFPLPTLACNLGMPVGSGIGKAIHDAGYDKVHFIAHSAGSWVATAAIQQIEHLNPNARTQCTLLDAYVSVAGKSYLGSGADYAEQYVSMDGVPGTNSTLEHCRNFDITAITGIDGDPNSVVGHAWPCQWYGQTVKDLTWPMGYGYGYALAMANNGGALPTVSDPAIGNIKVLPPESSSRQVLPSTLRHDTVLNLQDLITYKSNTGTVGHNGTALTMVTGSPVWTTSLLTVNDPVNLLSFQANFTSQPRAEGLLGVYWAGQLIGMIDERYALDGVQDYTFALPGTADPGTTYELSFRLDPYTDTPSSISIDNVATGYAVPEPSAFVLLGMGTISLLAHVWRRRTVSKRINQTRTD